MNKLILPGSTIGIIGGGQLGRMMTIQAKLMGYKVAVLDPFPGGPCAQVADYEINTPYDDKLGLLKLLKLSDVVTYEFENIPCSTLMEINHMGYIPQGYRPLLLSQNRAVEKQAISELGFKTAPYFIIKNKMDLNNGIEAFGYPSILKTCTGGYDGKGQIVINQTTDLSACEKMIEVGKCILEKFVNFKCELSAIVTRSTRDEITVFPIGENIHRNNILYQTIVPARISNEIQKKAQHLAIKLIKAMDLIGTLAVELFVTEEDEILVNEIAPRPHNSGHYTIEACRTSQFEQHIRAICGLSLGSTELIQNAVMVNILGQDLESSLKLLQHELFQHSKLHLYGKSESKINRKMGHINLLGEDTNHLLNQFNLFMNQVKGE